MAQGRARFDRTAGAFTLIKAVSSNVTHTVGLFAPQAHSINCGSIRINLMKQ
jgi:hypothetical protein